MIRIVKPAIPPADLTTAGSAQCARMCAEFDADPVTYQTGTKTFEFLKSIYGSTDIKAQLITIQNKKCCFCESKFQHVTSGDVEHFRPKGAFKQSTSDSLSKPGYFWLAYDWCNLLVCCEICNRRQKGNLFPLHDMNQRATPQTRDISTEDPLFINPEIDDPSQFIGFRAEIAFAINDNPRGKTTIEELGLNREPLVEMRKDKYDEFMGLINVVRLAEEPQRLADDQFQCVALHARARLRKAVLDDAAYSAMARAAIL